MLPRKVLRSVFAPSTEIFGLIAIIAFPEILPWALASQRLLALPSRNFPKLFIVALASFFIETDKTHTAN